MGEFEQVTTIYPGQGEPVGVGLITCGDGKYVCFEQGDEAIHLPMTPAVMHTLRQALDGCQLKPLQSELEEKDCEGALT